VRWIYDHYPNVVVLCMWVIDCEVLDDDTPEQRALGLAHDFAIIPRCDEIWAVGGRISGGMNQEINQGVEAGVPLCDLTYLGDEPPADRVDLPRLVWREQDVRDDRKACRRF
jgi:hypothetical protein